MQNDSVASDILNSFFLSGTLAGGKERAGEEDEIRFFLALTDCIGVLPCDMLAAAGWESAVNDGTEILHSAASDQEAQVFQHGCDDSQLS